MSQNCQKLLENDPEQKKKEYISRRSSDSLRSSNCSIKNNNASSNKKYIDQQLDQLNGKVKRKRNTFQPEQSDKQEEDYKRKLIQRQRRCTEFERKSLLDKNSESQKQHLQNQHLIVENASDQCIKSDKEKKEKKKIKQFKTVFIQGENDLFRMCVESIIVKRIIQKDLGDGLYAIAKVLKLFIHKKLSKETDKELLEMGKYALIQQRVSNQNDRSNLQVCFDNYLQIIKKNKQKCIIIPKGQFQSDLIIN